MDLVLKWCMGRKGESTSLFVVKRVVFTQLSELLRTLFSPLSFCSFSFFPPVLSFWTQGRKILKISNLGSLCFQAWKSPMDLRTFQAFPRRLKLTSDYIFTRFLTLFASSPECWWCLSVLRILSWKYREGKTLVNLLSTCQSHRCLPIYPHWANWRSLCARGGEITYKCARISPEGSQTCH